MKISAKTDYACRSILELALHWPNDYPLQVNEISRRQQIPIKFLIHILIYLKEHGFVKSTRGKKGGYVLAKPPSEIRLSDLIKNFENSERRNVSHPERNNPGGIMDSVWEEVDMKLSNVLKGINFESLSERARDSQQSFVYEI